MQSLPAKDQATFRSIVKFYENKDYKKGIRAADTILKKHPDHGETLCMKGLTLSYLDKKEEAYELVRRGLKCDLKSHVCWHVYGLLYRQDREYNEAIKCYRQALKIDPENLQILRDISLLQIHRRDFTGYVETRRKLLQSKSNNRSNWIGYAIAEHLCNQYEYAWTCLDNYEKTFKDEDVAAYDKSELYMYKAQIMEEGGKLEEALELLKAREESIVDKFGMLEAKGRINMFLGRFEQAEAIYRTLVEKNPEHHTYILALMASMPKFHRFWPALPKPVIVQPKQEADKQEEPSVPATIAAFPQTVHPQGMPINGWLPPAYAPRTAQRVSIGQRLHKKTGDFCEPLVPLTEEEQEMVCEFFDEELKRQPKSDALKRLLLQFITGERFQKRLDNYLRSRLRKGVPSLFRTMTPLYFQEGKYKLIEELLLQYHKCLEEEVSWFGPEVGQKPEPGFEPDEEPPSSLLFTKMVLADHYDFLGDTTKALEFCDGAIEHTPTMPELYALKARIFRHAGDIKESAKLYEEARSLDLADRYLNTKCVRALLRIDDTPGGMEKALLFSKDSDTAEAANLHDMQCMWYESHMGRSYVRQKKFGKALKQFHGTFKHFGDIAEDQFDFHNYCLRKTTLRAYVGMLRMQEKLYSHKFYRRAAKDALKLYVELFDRKARGEELYEGDDGGAGKEDDMSAADKKKLKHKMKREAKAKEEKTDTKATTAGGKAKKVDDDPDGQKLLEKDPMEESNKLLKTLVLYCGSDVATHTMSYEVLSRQGKPLQCLQALVSLWELAGRNNLNYKLVAPLAHFCHWMAKSAPEDTPEVVWEVILSETAPILGATEPFADIAALRAATERFVDQVERRVRENPELPVVEVMNAMKCLRNAGRDIKAFLEKEWQPKGAFALKECRKMLAFLDEALGKGSPALERFQKRCQEVFPLVDLS